MDILSEVLSNLPTILTAVSAIAAASIAYFNFRSRPILIRTLERHSDDLKALALKWKDQLPSFRFLEEGFFPDLGLPVPVESEFLFQDIWEHQPSDLDLSQAWASLKQITVDHYNARDTYWRTLDERVKSLTGLSRVDTLEKPGYPSDLIRFLFCDTFENLKRGTRPYTDMNLSRSSKGEFLLLVGGSYGIAVGTAGQLDGVAKVWKELVTGMKDSDPTLYKLAVQLVEQERLFWITRDTIVKQINEFLSIPIYSKICKYVKRSVASRKQIIRWKRAKKRDTKQTEARLTQR